MTSDFAQSGYDTFLTGRINEIDTRIAAAEELTLYTMASPMINLTTKAKGGEYDNGEVIVWDHYAGTLPFTAEVYVIDRDTGFRYLVPCVAGYVYQNGIQICWDNHMPHRIRLFLGNDGIRLQNNHGDDVNVLGSVRRDQFSLFIRALFDRKPELTSPSAITTIDSVPNDMNDNTIDNDINPDAGNPDGGPGLS